jgi:hypothetical protein
MEIVHIAGSGGPEACVADKKKCRGKPRHKFIGGITEWLCVAGTDSGAIPVIIHRKS